MTFVGLRIEYENPFAWPIWMFNLEEAISHVEINDLRLKNIRIDFIYGNLTFQEFLNALQQSIADNIEIKTSYCASLLKQSYLHFFAFPYIHLIHILR